MADLTSEDVIYLVRASQSDDMRAFEILVSYLERKTYALARSLAGNDSEAQDILQEIFVKLYLHIKDFNWEAAFTTWFYRLAKNTAIDFLRRRKRREASSLDATWQTDDGEMGYDLPDNAISPTESQEKKELADLVARSMQQLSEEQRSMLVMRDMMDASYEEIAAELHIPIGTVKSRIFRARAALKEQVLKEKEHYTGYLRHIDSKGGG